MGLYEDMERAEQERDAQEYECSLAFNNGYNKGIDDLITKCVSSGIIGLCTFHDISLIAEELKEGK